MWIVFMVLLPNTRNFGFGDSFPVIVMSKMHHALEVQLHKTPLRTVSIRLHIKRCFMHGHHTTRTEFAFENRYWIATKSIKFWSGWLLVGKSGLVTTTSSEVNRCKRWPSPDSWSGRFCWNWQPTIYYELLPYDSSFGPYSLDPVPSDYYLFLCMRNDFASEKFASKEYCEYRLSEIFTIGSSVSEREALWNYLQTMSIIYRI